MGAGWRPRTGAYGPGEGPSVIPNSARVRIRESQYHATASPFESRHEPDRIALSHGVSVRAVLAGLLDQRAASVADACSGGVEPREQVNDLHHIRYVDVNSRLVP